jgi:hypothetical protein
VIRPLAAAVALLLAVAAPARAEPVEITAQARGARATFLLNATPPGPAAAICLIDSGVNDTPDTAAVVGRFAVDGETSDRSPTLHGTEIASVIGAPRNEYGMVGFWPSARIVSVRANVDGQDTYTPARYVAALKRCDELAPTLGIQVVLLAFTSSVPLAQGERTALHEAVTTLYEHGINVVAAAGDTASGMVSQPASLSSVFTVGASDSLSGARCSFSSTSSTILAPGCTLDTADPATGAARLTRFGTDVAAALVATTLAALRSWWPQLNPTDAMRLVEFPDGHFYDLHLDVSAIFKAVGLDYLVAGLPPPVTTLPAASSDVDISLPPAHHPDAPIPARLRIDGPRSQRRPSARAFWLRGHLIALDGEPIAGATVAIQTRTFLPKPNLVSGPASPIGSVTTNTSGAFRVRIPAGPSRSLIASYSPMATDQIDVAVPAKIALRAKRRHIRNGQWAVLVGRVAGPIPYGGVPIALEVRNRGHWVPVPTSRLSVVTSNNGGFTLAYRFLRTFRTTTYRFRAVADEDSAFQYTRGTSRTVDIRVRP